VYDARVGGGHSEASGDTPNDRSRYTVPEAARVLGISPEAVRNRLSRGTLDSVKVEGTVYVLIDRDRARYTADTPTDRPDESGALTSALQDRIASLERQLEQANERDRENRRIIAALTSRIPAIEAPPDERESSEVADEPPGGGPPRSDAPGAQEGARRPWWRRVFGG
jgi:predicted ArsR family transcriptional regulator